MFACPFANPLASIPMQTEATLGVVDVRGNFPEWPYPGFLQKVQRYY